MERSYYLNMKLSLEALEALDAIDRHGSFAAAAKALHRVPSALTYTVQKLEQDLDVLLFDRSGHRAVLTEAGQELLGEGRHLLTAAGSLECRVRQVAKGWEAELVIAVNDLLPRHPLLDLLALFYAEHRDTRLRLTTETLTGCWDALADGRADLVLGASGDPPPRGGFAREHMGEMGFVFAMAPSHPLAAAEEPLPRALRVQHRAVVVADSSRRLPARTVGLLSGQETLTVPDMATKLAAQLAGLGVGFLPTPLAAPHVAAGQLVLRQLEEGNPSEALFLSHRSGHKGRALAWFRERLLAGALRDRLISA
jgi:DNA-binding transcriptional LysR family regulator